MHHVRPRLVRCPALIWRVKAALLNTSHSRPPLSDNPRPNYDTPPVNARLQPANARCPRELVAGVSDAL
jgi:hypothetical protein